MRRLIVWNLMSLDGSFEGFDKWDLSMHETAWGEELEAFSLEQLNDAGVLLFGRVTYEGMAAHWTKATGAIADFMNSIEKIVVSRTLKDANWNNSRVLDADMPEVIRKLKAEPGKNIYAFGSADLVAQLLRHKLVDEYRLCLAPVVLGKGNPLFKPFEGQLRMRLKETRPLKTGAVILFYEPQYSAS